MKAGDRKAIETMIRAFGKIEKAQSRLSFIEWTRLSRYLNAEVGSMEIMRTQAALVRFLEG